MIFHRVGSHTAGTKRRPSTAFFVSLGVHIVVAIAFMRMLILNADFSAMHRVHRGRSTMSVVTSALISGIRSYLVLQRTAS